ncbi:MAG: adenylate/guanylate cyclase domain-containing protein [Leptospiraceae bacterium]|nr:adenylate/guanylate cyclase domain-containing protein [Leptospiraceae bacterium]
MRNEFSNLLAAYFLVHLRAELQKSEELLNFVTLEGITFREFTEKFILEVEAEFPEYQKVKTKYNFFEYWHDKRVDQGIKPYKETSFKMFSQVFYSRILDYKYGTEDSRKLLQSRIYRILGVGKTYGRDFTFGIFFKAENKMKECLRELLQKHSEFDFEEVWKLIIEQSEFYTECAYSHFDSILKESLKRSDDLLLNILPEKIATELKVTGKTEPLFYSCATILFTDFKGFTAIAENLSPRDLVSELDHCFREFDMITEKYGLEKIKTIGDAYMCVGGIPTESETHAIDACLAALEMLEVMNKIIEEKKEKNLPYWEVRIGIHSGSVIAGVIGEKKFAYDVWGDSVNIASRLESSGEAGKINISSKTYGLVKDNFICEYRGKIAAKSKGELDMYFLVARK